MIGVCFGDFSGYLRFNSKTFFLDYELLQHLPSKRLVAGFHVREIQVGEEVGKPSQHGISHAVPEIKDPGRLTGSEP